MDPVIAGEQFKRRKRYLGVRRRVQPCVDLRTMLPVFQMYFKVRQGLSGPRRVVLHTGISTSAHGRFRHEQSTHLPGAVRALDPKVVLSTGVLASHDLEDVVRVLRVHGVHGFRHPLRNGQLRHPERQQQN